jgi:TatD DNase family protein
MLVDTHCHINMMVKSTFDTPLQPHELTRVQPIVDQAHAAHVTRIINVGTSLVESKNCVLLAQKFPGMTAAVGIHPNDLTDSWKQELLELEGYLRTKQEHKVVAVGECGLDFHYPDYNLQRQKDAFKAQIELALDYDVALVVHTRDAYEETLSVLEEFKGDIKRGVIHCFSEDQTFADTAISFGFVLGIGATLTYPKNNELRAIFANINLEKVVLETDAPFLPPQAIRGQQNSPLHVATVAQFLAELRHQSVDEIAQKTTENAMRVFNLPTGA